MPALKKYPPELKERAVRLLIAAREDAGGGRGASARIGQQLGIPADTLRNLNAHSAQRLLEVATELNERPRKTLNRNTPADLLSRLTSKKEITPVASTP